MDENSEESQWSTDVHETPSQGDGATVPELAPVQWSASEFISHQKSSSWYLMLGVAAAILTLIIVVVTDSIMSGIVIALICIVLGVFAARKPETKQYEINEYGVQVGDKAFPFENFKSFSVVEEGAVNSIWLRPIRKFLPTTVMYFGAEDEDRIIAMLENFLPAEDRALDTIDKFTRRIRF